MTAIGFFLPTLQAQSSIAGAKAVDVFYVTDLDGKKGTNAPRQTAIRHGLLGLLSQKALVDA